MTFYYALLLVIAVAMVLLGIMAILARVDKKRPAKQYDERQQTAQGKAFEWAVMVGFAYFGGIALLDLALADGLQATHYMIVMIGLVLEAFVFGCYCIFHDAYLPLTKSPKRSIIIMYVLGAVQMLNAFTYANSMRIVWTETGVSKIAFGEVILTNNRQSATTWIWLLIGVTSIILATLELFRYIRDKRCEP